MKPQGWEEVTLGQLAEFYVALRLGPSMTRDGLRFQDRAGCESLTLLRLGNTCGSTEQYLSEEGAQASVRVCSGDLIMSICASIGKPTVVDMDACIHDGFVVFANLSNRVNREFLYQLILSRDFGRHGQKGTQANINTTLVGQEPILLPPRAEQQLIAEILVNWDACIDDLRLLIRAKSARKHGLMQQLLTGRTRFKAFARERWREFAYVMWPQNLVCVTMEGWTAHA